MALAGLGIVAVQTGRLNLFEGDAEMYYLPLLGVLIPLPFVVAGALIGARNGWRR